MGVKQEASSDDWSTDNDQEKGAGGAEAGAHKSAIAVKHATMQLFLS